MRRTLLFLTIIGLAAVFAAGCPKKQTTPIEESVSVQDGAGTGATSGTAGGGKPVEEMPTQQEPFAEEPLSEGAGTGTDAEGTAGGKTGTLPLATVYFEYNSDELSPGAIAVLDTNAAWLRGHAAVRVLIEGNTDERGTLEYNLSLGARRANAVRNHLIRLGIPAEQLETISYGEDQPADAGHDEAAWARNRRCDFAEVQ